MPTTAVLLITCADQKGLVAAVSDFLYRHDGNIVHADQHTDAEKGVFLQRVEWELEGFGVPRDGIAEAFRPLAERFGMRWALHFSDERPRVAVLVSKLEHCLYDLLARWRMGELRAEVRLVASNHEDARPTAERFGVAFHHLPVTHDTRAAQEQALSALLDAEGIELIVLARYMQVLSAGFVERYAGRVINIHHSFLPAFAGARPYHQAHERVVRVSHRDSVRDLVRKGRDLEQIVLARAVDLHLRRRVIVYGNKTAVFG